ncbi:MAG: dTDP-4-dehydrorhamnose 3,5-epimerase [Verrucomicrobiota bacterium]
MKFIAGKLDGVVLIELEPITDSRGSFTRTYCQHEFQNAGLPSNWVQCNHTITKKKGAIRGMHWQAEPKGEDKIVRCIKGAVFDVVVDVRKESKTFGQWEAFELSEDTPSQLFIPKGFAHGFQCLSENCHLYYQMSEFYDPDLARGIRWDDPVVDIEWPLECTCSSKRDENLPFLDTLS